MAIIVNLAFLFIKNEDAPLLYYVFEKCLQIALSNFLFHLNIEWNKTLHLKKKN